MRVKNMFILSGDETASKAWCEANGLSRWLIGIGGQRDDINALAGKQSTEQSGNTGTVQHDSVAEHAENEQDRGSAAVDKMSFVDSLEQKMNSGAMIIFSAVDAPQAADRIAELVESKRYDVRVVMLDGDRVEGVGSESSSVLNGYEAIPSDDAVRLIRDGEVIDAAKYDAINFVGDIHGCATALDEILEKIGVDNGHLKDNELYVFCGDYVDRGVENTRVLEMIESFIDSDNVIVLEGNHERSLLEWGESAYIHANRFRDVTSVELERDGFSMDRAKVLYNKMKKYARFVDGDGREIIACHGGLSSLPEFFLGLNASALVRGDGAYNDTDIVEARWEETTGAPHGIYMIHGHRHNKQLNPHPYKHVFNVEGAVEHGAEIRCVRFARGCVPIVLSAVNAVFDYLEPEYPIDEMTDEEIVEYMNDNPYTITKHIGREMTSYMVSRDSFTRNAWKHQPIKARFIYIDNASKEMLARGYDKIFAIGEEPSDGIEAIARRFTYPVNVYLKENGYGGIVSGNADGDLMVIAKNTNRGAYASSMRRAVMKALGNRSKRFGRMLYDMNATAVFELVDPFSDRHIVEYHDKRLVLCAIIYNDYEFEQVDYDELMRIAREYKLNVKERVAELETISDAKEWYEKVTVPGYTLDGNHVKGFILEDSDGLITKVKTEWYEFWKGIRNIVRDLNKYGFSSKLNQFSDERKDEAKRIYEWLIDEKNADIVRNRANGAYKDIIDIRKEWIASEHNNNEND